MADRFEFLDMPKAADAPELVHDAARLLLTEIHGPISSRKKLNSQMQLMDQSAGALALEGGVVVGGGIYILESPGDTLTADLMDLAVISAYQRKGLGIGGKLLDLLEDKARGDGAEQMIVYSLRQAQGFYRKLGYRMTGESEFAKTL